MSSPSPAAAPSRSLVGRWTGVSIFLIVALCIALIGASGYVKYELDRSQAALVAQDVQLTPEQQAFDRVRRDLGYSGFLGAAQNFVATHDAALLPDMKNFLKQADESADKLPEKTTAELRHDLKAIVTTFDTAMQKAEKSTAVATPPSPDFTAQDLLPLYAALPLLDARVASVIAADRSLIQNQAQMWGMILTLISWGSLIIASALAAGIFLVLRDRNSAPMRALAQSIKNMARGDMRTSIWGMERQDSIGELARAVDMARFHFSQLPDMSLLSEQGPVRIRFEGNTRSLFEAMMRVISRDSEQVHAQADMLTNAVTQQQEALAHVVERVEAVLQNVEKRAMSGDQQVRQALQGMLGSAESLKHAQEHAADQLNRILPFLQERAQGIGEIAQITGKQVAQALQSLTLTERGLKSSAEQSENAIRKFSSTADTLGERMFGAINLLQASGKVLAETTETTQSRFDAVFERLEGVQLPHEPASVEPVVIAPTLDPQVTERLESAVLSLETSQIRLENLLSEQTQTTRAHIDLLSTQSGGLLTQASASSQTLSIAADRLRDEQTKLAELVARLADIQIAPTATPEVVPAPVIDTAPLMDGMRDGFAGLEQRLTALQGEEDKLGVVATGMKDGFVALEEKLVLLQSQIATLQLQQDAKATEQVVDSADQMRDHWYQMAAQIEATRSNLAQVILEQTARVEAYIGGLSTQSSNAGTSDFARDAQSQMEQQTLILNELVTTLSLLDAHMQELRAQVTEKRAG